MTLAEFERGIFDAAWASPICGIPIVRRQTPSAINLRIELSIGGFVDAFHNEETGTTAFAWIHEGKRVFGADNSGGWHLHPFADPALHVPLPQAMAFPEFMIAIARQALQ